jgi:hypothetical protein
MIDCVAVSFGGNGGSAATLGVNGTSGSTDTTNIVVGVTYRTVAATTAITPSITDSTTTRSGLAGTVSFKVAGSDDSALDNQNTDFIAANREYYDDLVANGTPSQCTSSTQTTGGCTGTFAQMSGITTCTLGVGYWVTDRGAWNNGSNGGQLYTCTTASPAAYTLLYEPYNYPHFLASGHFQSFTQQPTSIQAGTNFAPAITVTVSSGAADSITLSVSGTCGLTGASTVTAVAGVATFSGLGVGTTPAAGCALVAHDNTDATVADVTSSSFNAFSVMAFGQQPTNTASGATISPTITVTVTPAAADSMTLTVTSGTCTLTGSTTVTSNAQGVASFAGLVANATGSGCVLTAHNNTDGTASNITSGSFNITAAANTLSFTQQPLSLITGHPFSPVVVVTVSASVSDSITLSVNGCGTALTGTVTQSAVAGVATFAGLGVNGIASCCILTAHDNTDGTVLNITSNAFTVSDVPPVVNGNGGSRLHRLH